MLKTLNRIGRYLTPYQKIMQIFAPLTGKLLPGKACTSTINSLQVIWLKQTFVYLFARFGWFFFLPVIQPWICIVPTLFTMYQNVVHHQGLNYEFRLFQAKRTETSPQLTFFMHLLFYMSKNAFLATQLVNILWVQQHFTSLAPVLCVQFSYW